MIEFTIQRGTAGHGTDERPREGLVTRQACASSGVSERSERTSVTALCEASTERSEGVR
jgi:hypothetical protein